MSDDNRPARRIVQWLRCPGCGKEHTAAHASTFGTVVQCPCGVRFDAFTSKEVDR